MPPISPPDLVNAVSAFATVLSGLTALALTALLGRQPGRWLAVYFALMVTGLATVWYHGYGESLIAGAADIGTNLLLAWLFLLAVLYDFYSPITRRWVAGVSGSVILIYILWRLAAGASLRFYILTFGAFGGFNLGEVLLILTSLMAVILVYLRFDRLTDSARPIWITATAIFLIGALLATASNQVVEARVLAFHASWHLVGAFGFIFVWAFNHARFAIDPNQTELD